MEVSAIMNINELAVGRKVRANAESAVRKNEETRKQNKTRNTLKAMDDKDTVLIRANNQKQQVETGHDPQGEEGMNGTYVNILT